MPYDPNQSKAQMYAQMMMQMSQQPNQAGAVGGLSNAASMMLAALAGKRADQKVEAKNKGMADAWAKALGEQVNPIDINNPDASLPPTGPASSQTIQDRTMGSGNADLINALAPQFAQQRMGSEADAAKRSADAQAKLAEPYTLGDNQQRYVGNQRIASGPTPPKIQVVNGQPVDMNTGLAVPGAPVIPQQGQAPMSPQRLQQERELIGDRAAATVNEGSLLPEDTLGMMADQYLAGDKSVLTNLGRGQQGATNIVRLRKTIADHALAAGMDGRDIATKMAEFTGIVSGERTLGNRTANIGMAVTEAQKLGKLAREASHAITRTGTGFVPFDQALQAIQKGTNNPQLRAFVAANNSYVNVYARAISPTGVPNLSDKDHAREMLSTAFDEQSYDAVLDQLDKEMAAAQQSPETVRQEFRDAIGPGKGNVAPIVQGRGAAPQGPQAPLGQAQQAPQPGTVEGGFRFKGGNPADQKNWEPVR